MIYIAYNHKGQPISIVKAKSLELANAYWHGAGTFPYKVESEDAFDIENNGTGVIPILKTKDKRMTNNFKFGDTELVVI